jgi:prepilin-type N-terminal cleavage/methylation domain-containing protein
MNLRQTIDKPLIRRLGFTLVEMMVVIGIIGLVTALLIPGFRAAVEKRDRSRAEAELRKLELLINNYKDKFGSYPPDNPGGPVTNGLYYELSGTKFTAASFQTLDGLDSINNLDVTTYFGIPGFLNTMTNAPPPALPPGVTLSTLQAKNYLPELKPDQSALISTAPPVRVLTAPGKPAPGNTIIVNGQPVNPWRYNCTTPIHNPGRFDLWAEINIGGVTNIIGNWKN